MRTLRRTPHARGPCPAAAPSSSRRPLPRRTRGGRCRAEGERGEGDSTESLFQRELRRRGINSPDDLDDAAQRTATSQPEPPPLTRSQLEESRRLNSEGLEGLIPRAKQLVTLGGTFFLAFVPFILAVALATSGLYWAVGSGFIHGGRPSYQRYIDPQELLAEPTVDERIPF